MGCGSSSDPAFPNTYSGEGGDTDEPLHRPPAEPRSDHVHKGHNRTQEKTDTGHTAKGPSESDQTTRALLGDIEMACPSPTKIVRIFTSSTFTDTQQERNMLMKHAYPKVKEHCRRIGYEFQVADMRWGVRDEAIDDHMTTELCLKEIELCKKVSTGQNFMTLMSHKYGYKAFPRVIEATHFKTLMTEMEEEIKQLFQRWYSLDTNAVPPAYILSPISARLPDFLSPDVEKKKQAKQIWWDDNEKMQHALDVTAPKVFDKERARGYTMSVTETEITEGLLKLKNPSKTSMWFRRDIEDIEEQPNSYLLSRFIECTDPDEKWQNAREMMNVLKENVAKKLPKNRILTYSVRWNQASGINPEEDTEHQEYLDTLCQDFVTNMTAMIDASVAERAQTDDRLLDECCQHIRFCQSKCEGFRGRQDTLELIRAYVRSSSSEPLVLHGISGSGKTSTMAMAAKMMKRWTSNPPAVVLRFLGTSPDSSSIMSLLESVTSQICRIYRQPPLSTTDTTMDTRCKEFKAALTMGQPDQPLILMLDSLDQLDRAYDARKLGWLIMKLVPGTKVIVSTLPEPIYDCFPALQSMITSKSNFVCVPVLDKSDVRGILDNWLKARKRSLTDRQMTTVLGAFKTCPTPLFLKLSFEEASTWSSFVTADKTVLQHTARAIIDSLFQKLEKTHGKILVSKALGYLTLANNGLTETELEDILSCDDDVLNDVYMYWTPPIRRLPPLLMVRVRTDLDQYLVERGADGVRVIFWYHRQFIEAAEARYCSDKAVNRLTHNRLADFFNGAWAAGKKKPYTNAKGESGEEDRHVSLQPLKFGPDSYNLRTLNNLPFHLIHAEQLTLLKDICLANPTFIIHKLEAVPLYSVLRDYAMAKQKFPDDDLINEVLHALNLSQKALTTDPRQIVPQLLQRLDDSRATHQLLERCRAYPDTYILPTKRVLDRPGGQLVHSISATNGLINTLDVTADGTLAVTACSGDNVVILWDLEEGKKKLELKDSKFCEKAMFCNHDKWVACGNFELDIRNVDTGGYVMTLADSALPEFCPLGKGKTFIMLFQSKQYRLINVLENTASGTSRIQLQENLEISLGSLMAGSDNYLAATPPNRLNIIVYDLKARQFGPSFRGFPSLPYEEKFQQPSVDAIVISRDESHVIYTTQTHGEVVFANFGGNKLRTIPPDGNRHYTMLNITRDGTQLYVSDKKTIYFYDTTTLQELDRLDQQRQLSAVITNDAVNVVTVSDGGNLCIWDRSRQDRPRDIDSATKLHGFSFVHALNNPRYMLLCGHIKIDEETTPHLRLEVYDVFEKSTAVSGELNSEDDEHMNCIQAFNTKTDNHVILVLGRNQRSFFDLYDRDRFYNAYNGVKPTLLLVRVDLQTMTVIKNYIGFTNITTKVVFLEETEEIVCTTKAARHVKLYDKNGDVMAVIKTGQKKKIIYIQADRSGTVACASCDKGGPLMLFDLNNRKHMYNIDSGNFRFPLFDPSRFLLINQAGSRLVFQAISTIPEVPVMHEIAQMVVWDIKEGKEAGWLYDAECQREYMDTDAHEETDVRPVMVYELDGTRIVSTHNDSIIRVWDIHSCELLCQLRGHTGVARVLLCEKSPYILSYSLWLDDDCFMLWDKQSYECVARFNLDRKVNDVSWSVDGKFWTSIVSPPPPDVTTWRVHHGHSHMTFDDKDYPYTFSHKEEAAEPMAVRIYKHNELEIDGDPDSLDSDEEFNPWFLPNLGFSNLRFLNDDDDYDDDDDDDDDD